MFIKMIQPEIEFINANSFSIAEFGWMAIACQKTPSRVPNSLQAFCWMRAIIFDTPLWILWQIKNILKTRKL